MRSPFVTTLLAATLLTAPLAAQVSKASQQGTGGGPWGGSAQVGALVLDDRLGAALGTEWVAPIGSLNSPDTPSTGAEMPNGPRRIQARPWAVAWSVAAGPSLSFNAGPDGPDSNHNKSELGFTLLGSAALQRRLNGSLRAGLGFIATVGDGRGLGGYLRGDYEGVVVIKAGWLKRDPLLAIMLDWALLRDSAR